ncbi:ComEC/Rec2 family competence protein [Parasediminibacterium paludis]|uniref:ComEC/Rec2 family competence protein n=1 Tax=Parasediminibacterium paludis TaxID=908966 RepID=A0ABV8PZM0_9BACT
MLKLLLPLVFGILIQYRFHVSPSTLATVSAFAILAFAVFSVFPIYLKFAYAWIKVVAIQVLFIGLGTFITYNYDGIAQSNNVVNNYEQQPIIATIQAPLVPKPKSYKALVSIDAVFKNGHWLPINGKALLYFKKDSSASHLTYGSQIVITKPLSLITNLGNPGGFNYQEYCSFQHIYYQAFVSGNQYLLLASTNSHPFTKWLFTVRDQVLATLRTYIHAADELAVAEALLIGYRDDLDRDLVQRYSNTGVVHIIAISGLHLGMIYGMLSALFGLFKQYRATKIIKPIVIILVLWLFTLIAGAAPSILRSAIMFTFIVLGDAMRKRSNIYNTLALSAFVILIVNPYSLWDVGFQLSYSAVLSIILFYKYILQWFYFKNKLLKWFWALNAVTLSAQILTLPIIIYHFHQLPTLFFITNLVAVPLSGLILYAELALLITTWFTPLAKAIGWLTEHLLAFMNDFIARVDDLPFSILNGLQIHLVQVALLYAIITAATIWLLQKSSKALLACLSFACFFCAWRYWDFMGKYRQHKMIVYNVPNYKAIDLIDGRYFQFVGDSVLQEDGFLSNFHLRPSRILHRIAESETLSNSSIDSNIITANGKTIVVIDKPLPQHFDLPQKINADVIVLSHNPKIYFSTLAQAFNCKQYVFDASNLAWKIKYWKKDADSLGISYHVVAEKGAFEMDL